MAEYCHILNHLKCIIKNLVLGLCDYTGRQRSPPFLYTKENTQTACVYHFSDVRKMIGKPPTLLSRIGKETIKAINHEMVNDTRH